MDASQQDEICDLMIALGFTYRMEKAQPEFLQSWECYADSEYIGHINLVGEGNHRAYYHGICADHMNIYGQNFRDISRDIVFKMLQHNHQRWLMQAGTIVPGQESQ